MTENTLSPSERMILDYIKYRTNKNASFYGSNGHIATYIGIKPSSAKVLVNGLIKKGYLARSNDGIHQRTLALTGKEYLPMTGCNMSDIDKAGLKKERNEYQQEYEQLVTQYNELQKENEQLKQQIEILKMAEQEVTNRLQNEFMPDYRAKILRIKDLEAKLSVFMNKV